MSTPNEHRYVKRSALMVRFTARYQVVIPAAISQVFFGSVLKQSGNVLKGHAGSDGPLKAHLRGLPGGLTCYTLSHRGCVELGVPAERAEALGPTATDLALGVLYFSTLADDVRRYRVEHRELVEIMGKGTPAPNVVHVYTEEDGQPRILRAYQSAQHPAAAIKRMRQIQEEIEAHPTLGNWAGDGSYGVLLLVPSRAMAPELRKLAAKQLSKSVFVQVGLGPTAATLAAELRRRKKL